MTVELPCFSAQVQAFLSAERASVLFCRDEQGAPIGYPMTVFAVVGHQLLFSTYTKSAKVNHLRRDPRAAFIVTAAATPAQWLKAQGTVALHHPSDAEIDEYFSARTSDPRVPNGVADSVKARLRDRKRVILVFTPHDPIDITISASQPPPLPRTERAPT